jgi:hypothetical protein
LRFPLAREVQYKVLEDNRVVATGTGTSVNMSSGGVAFTVEHTLPAGAFIEVSISWPILLDDVCPMRLVSFGKLIRCTTSRAVASVVRYEFRTQSHRTLVAGAQAPLRNDSMLLRFAAECTRKDELRSAAPPLPAPAVAAVAASIQP